MVQLDHEDILKLRCEKVDSVLLDLIDGAVENDTCTYVQYGDSSDHFVADLVLLGVPDQKAIRKAWSAFPNRSNGT